MSDCYRHAYIHTHIQTYIHRYIQTYIDTYIDVQRFQFKSASRRGLVEAKLSRSGGAIANSVHSFEFARKSSTPLESSREVAEEEVAEEEVEEEEVELMGGLLEERRSLAADFFEFSSWPLVAKKKRVERS